MLAVTTTCTVPQRLASAATPVSLRVTTFLAVAFVSVRVAAAAWPTGIAMVSAPSSAAVFVLITPSLLPVDESPM